MPQPYTFEKLPGEPLLLGTVTSDFKMARDMPLVIRELKRILDSSPEPLYDVVDIRDLSLSFSDVVAGLAAATHRETGVLPHPNLRRLVVVTEDWVTHIGVNALRQPQYGGNAVAVFATLDQALAAVRSEIRELSQARR